MHGRGAITHAHIYLIFVFLKNYFFIFWKFCHLCLMSLVSHSCDISHLYLCLSCAISSLMFNFLMSPCATYLLQVFFGLPTGLLPFTSGSITCDVVEFPYVVLGAFALTCFFSELYILTWTFIKTIHGVRSGIPTVRLNNERKRQR